MTKQERVAMGHRLRQQRTLLGLTREEFAELADISAGYYGQIEVGTSQMSIDTLIKLSKTSQLSMEYILLGEEYGSFIELAPNLSGLADAREDLRPGDGVSVYIKSIRPERMKIKLQVIEKLPPLAEPEPLRYQITDGVLDRWVYSPAGYEKPAVETVFTAEDP